MTKKAGVSKRRQESGSVWLRGLKESVEKNREILKALGRPLTPADVERLWGPDSAKKAQLAPAQRPGPGKGKRRRGRHSTSK